MKKIAWSVVRISFLVLVGMIGFTTSCSHLPDTKRDKELSPYVERFKKDMNMSNTSEKEVSFRTLVSFDSKDGESETIGVCYPYSKQIFISPKFWYSKSITEKRKTALVYHEMAHCVCDADHFDEPLSETSFCPKSLMQSSLPSNICLQQNWEHYIKDLKKRCE